jgi:hypothetical protein
MMESEEPVPNAPDQVSDIFKLVQKPVLTHEDTARTDDHQEAVQ